jgi:hypothetical protein
MRLHWDDKKVACTIDTPKGYSVALSEEDGTLTVKDEHGNKLTLSDTGIAMDSAKDIALTATGDVTIKGKNVTAQAQMQAGIEGGSAAELKASGSVTIKGGMVQIN